MYRDRMCELGKLIKDSGNLFKKIIGVSLRVFNHLSSFSLVNFYLIILSFYVVPLLPLHEQRLMPFIVLLNCKQLLICNQVSLKLFKN